MERFRLGLGAIIGALSLEVGCGIESSEKPPVVQQSSKPSLCSPEIKNFIAEAQQDTGCTWDEQGSRIEVLCTFVTETVGESGECAVACTGNKGEKTGDDTVIISPPYVQNGTLNGLGALYRSSRTRYLGIAPTVCAKSTSIKF